MAKYVYPAIFHEADEGGYWIEFPDWKGATQGEDLENAIYMAEDFVGLACWDAEKSGDELPVPTNVKNITTDANSFISLIRADTAEYAKHMKKIERERAIKKTLTIPAWLNDLAVENHISFSGVLQEALKQKLGVA